MAERPKWEEIEEIKEEIKKFLIEARRNTYASGKAPEYFPSGEKCFTYRGKGELAYKDTYYDGPLDFVGQEVVFWTRTNGCFPVWSMVYGGGIIASKIIDTPRRVQRLYEFLKEALLCEAEQARLPGTAIYMRDDFEYFCTIDEFRGEEYILVPSHKDIAYKASFLCRMLI